MVKPKMTDKQREAIKIIAKMVSKTGAYDYVDETVEIRLYGEEIEVFDEAVELSDED